FQCTRLRFFKPNLSAPKAPLRTPVSCTEESSSKPRVSMARMPLKRASVAVTLNIALRPRSGDLIVMNAGLAKPIPQYLLYYMAAHRAGPVRVAGDGSIRAHFNGAADISARQLVSIAPPSCLDGVLRRTIGQFLLRAMPWPAPDRRA